MMFRNREDEISSSRPFFNPDTTSIMAAPGHGCPRCGGAVFAAEQQLAKGTVSFQLLFRTIMFIGSTLHTILLR